MMKIARNADNKDILTSQAFTIELKNIVTLKLLAPNRHPKLLNIVQRWKKFHLGLAKHQK